MEEAFSTLFSTLWEIWKDMASIVWSALKTGLHFFLWALCGLIILPCVFIAGQFYPDWMKWGEKF